MKIHELIEAASGGSTSAASVGSLGGSPNIVAGPPKALKRWSGSPGKMGHSIKPPTPKLQKPTDNALNAKGSIIA